MLNNNLELFSTTNYSNLTNIFYNYYIKFHEKMLAFFKLEKLDKFKNRNSFNS